MSLLHPFPLARHTSLCRASAGRSARSQAPRFRADARGFCSNARGDKRGVEVGQALGRVILVCAHAANLQEVGTTVMCQTAPISTQVRR